MEWHKVDYTIGERSNLISSQDIIIQLKYGEFVWLIRFVVCKLKSPSNLVLNKSNFFKPMEFNLQC